MLFDDRLATVLRNRASSKAIARIQYRQLLDLLGTLPAGAQSARIDTAYDRLGELSGALPTAERAAMLAEPGIRLRCPRLVAALASSEPDVASAAIRQARLSEGEWLDLAPALPIQARAVMRARSDLGPAVDSLMARLGIHDRGLPPAEAHGAMEAPAAEPPAAARIVEMAPSLTPAAEALPEQHGTIGAIVKRIEDYRKSRQDADALTHALARTKPQSGMAPGEAPPLPADNDGSENDHAAGSPPACFDFVTDAEGRVTWASEPVGGMAIGLRIGGGEEGALQGPPELALALRHRQPLRGHAVTITGAPAISTRWRLDGAPRFDSQTGRFTGYHGRMRRLDTAAAAPGPVARAAAEGDRIRQLLHELRTPINAIQGFAEVIQQQLFAPTPHEYRALAATIAGDAARMLAAFEELERLAKLDSGAMRLEPGTCDLGALLGAMVARLEPFTTPRGSGLALKLKDSPLPVALAPMEAERLVWRLLAALAGAAAPGEVLYLRARIVDGRVRLSLQLPAALAARGDEDLFRASAPATPQALSAGMFGTGFALRLARAEAQAAGGTLERRGEKLRLELSALTSHDAGHSEAIGG